MTFERLADPQGDQNRFDARKVFTPLKSRIGGGVNMRVTDFRMWHKQISQVKGPPRAPTGPSSYFPDGWAAANEQISDDNLLWRQYVLFVELYRYYIDLIWKVSIWFYTATGVSLAYFFTHYSSGNHKYLPLLLLFLGTMAVGTSRIFGRAVNYVGQMENWLEYIAVSLKLPGRPHVEFIRWFCQFVSATLLIVAVSCFGFFVYLHA